MKNCFYTLFLLLNLLNCHFTRNSFETVNVNYLKKLNKGYNEYVIHFERITNWETKEINGKVHVGIIYSLKNCNLKNKRISRYVGFSKFLNSSSEELQILSNNLNGITPIRLDLQLILDDIVTSVDSMNNLSANSATKTYSRNIYNFNLYHYSITDPLINFEFKETVTFTSPTFTNKQLEDYFILGKLVGNELCNALNNLN